MGRVIQAIAGLGRLTVPLGLFALVAVGIHAGADRVDDHALVLLNLLDGWFDAAGSRVIGAALEALGYGAATVQRGTFAWVDLVDLEAKDWLARVSALVVELASDAVLAVPLFLHRRRDVRWRELGRRAFADPTVLRAVAPAAAGLAAVAGILVIAREVQVASHAALAQVGVLDGAADPLARGIGLAILGLVTWRLGARVVASAVCWSDRVGAEDASRLRSPGRRRLRGWGMAALVLPVTALAAAETLAGLEAVRALLA